MQILVIEDNFKLAANLKVILEGQGYGVSLAAKGTDGLNQIQAQEFDLIILDLNLPDIDGMEVCKIIRNLEVSIPILMLTARVDMDSKVKGLDLGADDYLTKPFEAEELLARIRVLLRRESKSKSAIIDLGEIRVDLRCKKIYVKGIATAMSTTEMRIIEYLLNNRGKVCSQMDVYQSVWGDEVDSVMFSDTLKVHIARIRKKLGKDLIQTQLGQGYFIE
jgi:two-component system OmpR family response regulator/two-component system response regulator QseB